MKKAAAWIGPLSLIACFGFPAFLSLKLADGAYAIAFGIPHQYLVVSQTHQPHCEFLLLPFLINLLSWSLIWLLVWHFGAKGWVFPQSRWWKFITSTLAFFVTSINFLSTFWFPTSWRWVSTVQGELIGWNWFWN